MNKDIVVSSKIHKLLKIKASEEGKSIKGLVTGLIEDYLGIKPENNESDK